MKLTNDRNNKLNFFADPVLIKMAYFDDFVNYIEKVYDLDYRGKIRAARDAYVCSKKLMLPP